MHFYHCSFCTDDIQYKCFVPRVPRSVGKGEDRETKRICLGPSVEKCVQAMGAYNRNLCKDAVITVYHTEIDLSSENLLKPYELYQMSMVPDSLENEEYWFLAELVMTGQQYRITDLDGCFDIAWSCINYNDMIQIIRRLVKRESTKIQYAVSLLIYEAKTSSELYSAVVKCAEEVNAFKFVDDLWDEIVELPWAQLYRINKITCIPCNHSMNCFG